MEFYENQNLISLKCTKKNIGFSKDNIYTHTDSGYLRGVHPRFARAH